MEAANSELSMRQVLLFSTNKFGLTSSWDGTIAEINRQPSVGIMQWRKSKADRQQQSLPNRKSQNAHKKGMVFNLHKVFTNTSE